jgi:hypothetical protein
MLEVCMMQSVVCADDSSSPRYVNIYSIPVFQKRKKNTGQRSEN